MTIINQRTSSHHVTHSGKLYLKKVCEVKKFYSLVRCYRQLSVISIPNINFIIPRFRNCCDPRLALARVMCRVMGLTSPCLHVWWSSDNNILIVTSPPPPATPTPTATPVVNVLENFIQLGLGERWTLQTTHFAGSNHLCPSFCIHYGPSLNSRMGRRF